MEQVFDAVEEKREEVRQDRGLSQRGRNERLRRLDQALADRIRSLAEEEPVEDLESRLEEMERDVISPAPTRTQPDDLDEAGDFGIRAERVQDRLYDLEPRERFEKTLQAARSDDRVTMAAVESAPDSFPLLNDDELRLIQEIHARTRWPDRVEKLENVRTGISRIRANLNTAMGLLARETGNNEFEVKPFPHDAGDHPVAGSSEEVTARAEARAEA